MTILNTARKYLKLLRGMKISLRCLMIGGAFIGAFSISTAANGSSSGMMDAFRKCQLVITEVNQRTNNKYDPLSYDDYLQPIQLRVRNVGARSCSGSVRFDLGASSGKLEGRAGDALNFLLVGEFNVRKILFNPKRITRNSLSINLDPGRSTQFNLRLYISRGQTAISGKYLSQIDAVYRGRQDDYQQRIAVHFGAYVRASVQANFVGVDRLRDRGLSGSVKLGELSPGLRRKIGLQLRSNSLVDVSISSSNRGELAHKSLPNMGIGYNMRIAGRNIDLSTQTEVTLPTNLSRDGLTNPIEVELDNYGNAPAGRYSDVIHVRVSAR